MEVDVLIQDANLLGSSLGLWLFLNSAVVCGFPSGGFTMGRAKSLSWYVVFANASVSDPIAISSKSAALPGQTLRRQAFVPQLLVAF